MNPRYIQLQRATELLAGLLSNTGIPADRQIEHFFRQHRNMGPKDRGFAAETVYGCLRRRRSLGALAGRATSAEEPAPEDLIAAFLLTAQSWSARALVSAGYRGDAEALASRARTLQHEKLALAVRADLPDWLAERLVAQLGEAETSMLAAALNQPACVDLRVNTLKAEREKVAARLAEEGYEAEPTPYSPVGLRRRDRSPLFSAASFQEGLYEVQDEGSQLIGFLVEPRRRERIVDFCAGSGGKSLQLGALMADSGTLYAFDVSERRLDQLRRRLARSGLGNIRPVVISDERDRHVKRLAGKIDRVLVDAPCSGTGTLRRNPDIKWRPIDLDAITATQGRILGAAATLVRPGGRLVYATCSLLVEENEDIVRAFLVEHPEFQQVSAAEALARRQIAVEGAITREGALRLYPHRHGTDGFYAAALDRRVS